MKWLCTFLKGSKPGEPNRRRPRITAGEEEDTLWQPPVRPKVLIPLLPSSSLTIFFFKWFFQSSNIPLVLFHIQFSLHLCCTMLEQAFTYGFVNLLYSE
jgi:hypothetical protein